MSNNSSLVSRRAYLAGAGATTAAAIAGCIGGDSDQLDLAYMPIFPDLQYFVMESEGYFDEIEADIDSQEFSDGPAIVQAYGGGEIDIAMFGVVPSMTVIDRGLPAQVTAANIQEPMAIMADEEFQGLWNEHEADAFDVWEDEHGEQFRFGTFPEGSVPDMLLRYWFDDVVGIDPESVAEVIEIDGASAVFQAIANDEVDGVSIMEPVPTRAEMEGFDVTTFRTAAEIMPGQPAAVTLMHDDVRDSDVAVQFLEQHVRATEFISENIEETAQIVEDGIDMPADQAEAALEGPLSNFITDPREIEDATEIFAEFAYVNGQIDQELSLDEIFDYSVYNAL